ncbi:MAG: hydrogenase maturation nickel metallochaperone HypA [Snowella sp.]|nr:hydrogenase maturation nickel metallochaperone HypA [Snowella sp.]
MHELGITENILEIALQQAQGKKIYQITLEIGQLTAILPDSIAFCFEACRQDTPLAATRLKIIEIPGRARCRQCQAEFAIAEPFGLCECGSIDLDFIQGQELQIKELEMEELCA